MPQLLIPCNSQDLECNMRISSTLYPVSNTLLFQLRPVAFVSGVVSVAVGGSMLPFITQTLFNIGRPIFPAPGGMLCRVTLAAQLSRNSGLAFDAAIDRARSAMNPRATSRTNRAPDASDVRHGRALRFMAAWYLAHAARNASWLPVGLSGCAATINRRSSARSTTVLATHR